MWTVIENDEDPGWSSRQEVRVTEMNEGVCVRAQCIAYISGQAEATGVNLRQHCGHDGKIEAEQKRVNVSEVALLQLATVLCSFQLRINTSISIDPPQTRIE